MDKITLKFVSPHIERSFKAESVEDHIHVMRLCIRIILIGLVLWTILEFSAESDRDLGYVVIRGLVLVAWILITIYTSTFHYRMNVYFVTKWSLFFIVVAKFLIEISF